MKIFLALSLILNVVLAYVAVGKKETTPVMERVIIETHSEPRKVEIKEARGHVVESLRTTTPDKTKQTKHLPMGVIEFQDADVQDAGERMDLAKEEFLKTELGISEEVLNEHQKLRAQFYQENGALWDQNLTGELSFEQKRALIDLEEEYHRKLEKLYGKENWKKFQKFRENYNRNGLKRQREENRPFVFMGI